MARVLCSDCCRSVRVLVSFTSSSAVEVRLLEKIDLLASLMTSSFWKVPPPFDQMVHV